MQVILLEDVKSLGKKGEVVDINEGYARNFIIKKKLGRSFGSVSTKEIAAAIKAQLGYELDKKKMALDVPIKCPGTYNLTVKLHQKVTGELKVVVKEA